MKERPAMARCLAFAGGLLLAGLAAAPARADFFDDLRRTFTKDIPRTFEHDIPHTFQHDIPRAFGADGGERKNDRGHPKTHPKTHANRAPAATPHR